MAINFAQDASQANRCYLKLDSPVVTEPPFTFFAWYKPDAAGPSGACIVATSRYLQSFAANSFMMLMAGETPDQLPNIATQFIVTLTRAFAGSQYATGSWQSSAVWSESTSHLQADINGVPGTANTSAYTWPTDTAITIIGGHPSASFDVLFQRPYTGCLGWVCGWDIVLPLEDRQSLAAGVAPNRIQSGNLVMCLPMLTSATAGANLAGTDFTVFQGSGTSAITDCVDGPPILAGGSSYVRIMG